MGQDVGILGLGAIRKAVAKRKKGFCMRTLAYDLYPYDAYAEHLFADL
ncbi:hypothetical protein JQC72_05175 [Polycladomyces sp. WAk]|uniref:D-isomer specific 2-hydroxyacid dehydrogenase NAD-binding domain-containing protein n=1 Tax=Polycladomyces zharkentensis TaxID=2807616 RepID=A0ABS2WHG6_9BACL|nr:NAD(P)-dependent oxidoreductase [Polycladomyces sp. WAk]MBN2908916.1 hypothetical protein [Polycladomyces sp. WAk]